jgi:hypothetical protein
MDFESIRNHIIPMADFRFKWRFTEANHAQLPAIHLDQLKPLDAKASKFLWDYVLKTNLHQNVPFKKDFFRTIDKAAIKDGNEQEIKKWLYRRGLPFEKEVFLSWQPSEAMIVPWKIFVKYFDSFYYSVSDDLTVFDQSLNWALLFYHEDEIYFGTNQDYTPSEEFADHNFIW